MKEGDGGGIPLPHTPTRLPHPVHPPGQGPPPTRPPSHPANSPPEGRPVEHPQGHQLRCEEQHELVFALAGRVVLLQAQAFRETPVLRLKR